MNARDEIAALAAQIDHEINDLYSPGDDVMGEDLAVLLHAAGYRKPRTITTSEELDALAEETLISTPCNNPRYRNVFRKAWAQGWLELDPSDREDGENTETAAALLRWNSKDGTATVLYEPTPGGAE